MPLPSESLSTPILWASYIAGVSFLGIGVRGVFDPTGAASFFGVPLQDKAGLTFVRAYGARNIGLSLTAIALTYFQEKTGLAALLAASALISVFDAGYTIPEYGLAKGAKHIVYVVVLGAFAAWVAH